MIDVTIKTLDSRNHSFSVEDEFTVKQLKEHIAESVNVPAESQRLIYCGRVLQDDKKLSECDVHGKVIHLVQRAPPSSTSSNNNTNSEPRNTSGSTRRPWRLFPGGRDGNAMYLGAMAFPADLIDAQGITLPQPRHALSQSRLSVARSMLRRARNILNALENPGQEVATESNNTNSSSTEDLPRRFALATRAAVAAVLRDEATSAAATSAAEAIVSAATGADVASAASTESANTDAASATAVEAETPPSDQGAAAASGDFPEDVVITEPFFGFPSSEEASGDTAQPEEPSGATAKCKRHSRARPKSEQGSRARSSSERPARASADAEQPSSSTPGESSQNPPSSGSGRTNLPSTSCLAELISQVNDVNRRLRPFLDQYYNLMNEDPVLESHASAQAVFNQVSETMHFMAHAYHALSDVMCDFSRPPPRLLRCRPVLIQHSAVLQTGFPGFPVQAQVNISARSSQETNSSNNSSSEASAAAGASATPTGGSAPATPTRGRSESNASAAGASSTPNAASQSTLSITVSERQDEPGSDAESANHHPRIQVFRTSLNDLVTSAANNAQSGDRASGRSVPMFGPSAEVFMDVGLGSITIDSIDAALPTQMSANQGSGESGPTISGPFAISASPPAAAELFHNLMQSLAGTIFTNGSSTPSSTSNGNNGNNASTTSANNASTSPSSTTTNSAQEPSSTSTNSQARGNTSTNPTTATQTRSTTRPHVHIGPGFPSMSGQAFFDPFLPCSSHHIRGSRRRNASQQSANGPVSNNQSDSTSHRHNRPLTPPANISSTFEELTNSLSGRGFAGSRISDAFTALRSLFSDRTMPQSVQQAFISNTSLTMTVGEALETVFPRLQQHNDDPFIQYFMDLARELRVRNILNNNGLNPSAVVNILRTPLLQTTRNLIGSQKPTSAEITEFINKVNARAKTFIEAMISHSDLGFLRDDVDIVATVSQLNRTVLHSLVETIVDDDDVQYYASFPVMCGKYARLLTYIWMYYCNYTVTGVTSMLIHALEQLFTDIPFTFMAMARARFVSWQRSIASPTPELLEAIHPYLVYRTSETASESQMEGASAQSISSPSQTQPMETESGAEVTLSPLGDPLPDPLPDVIIGAEPWHSAVPHDWVPIISHDRERQRRQAVQGPLSESYLSGMPSKRRKVVASTKPNGNLTRVISDSMSTALGAAGIVDVDDLADRAGSDTNLRAAYREQVKTTVETTLKNHPDYKPDKYPNASKLFGPK